MKKSVYSPANSTNLIATAELPKREGMQFQRVILCSVKEDEWVVSTQCGMEIDDFGDVMYHRSWDQGHYYRDEGKAQAYFLARVKLGWGVTLSDEEKATIKNG